MPDTGPESVQASANSLSEMLSAMLLAADSCDAIAQDEVIHELADQCASLQPKISGLIEHKVTTDPEGPTTATLFNTNDELLRVLTLYQDALQGKTPQASSSTAEPPPPAPTNAEVDLLGPLEDDAAGAPVAVDATSTAAGAMAAAGNHDFAGVGDPFQPQPAPGADASTPALLSVTNIAVHDPVVPRLSPPKRDTPVSSSLSSSSRHARPANEDFLLDLTAPSPVPPTDLFMADGAPPPSSGHPFAAPLPVPPPNVQASDLDPFAGMAAPAGRAPSASPTPSPDPFATLAASPPRAPTSDPFFSLVAPSVPTNEPTAVQPSPAANPFDDLVAFNNST